MTTVAFDVDNCLTRLSEGITIIHEPVRILVVSFTQLPQTRVIVWSGGGELHARLAGMAAGLSHLPVEFMAKNTFTQPDIVFDDEDASALGKVCVRI